MAKAEPVKVLRPKYVLLISSQVAASQVGAGVSGFCLRRLGHEVVTLPTTLMGRHPGWGAPGGGAVKTARLSEMWDAIKAQDITFDAVMTGYMGEADHIPLAAQIIGDVRTKNPDAVVLIDPVLGDGASARDGSLYIPDVRAAAIRDTLVPLADIITPNRWELSWLSGKPELSAARAYKRAIVTSVPTRDGDIGAAFIDGTQPAYRVSHARFAQMPHGGGDALAALYLGYLLSGDPAPTAFARSVAAVFALMSEADRTGARELPLIAGQWNFDTAQPLKMTEILRSKAL